LLNCWYGIGRNCTNEIGLAIPRKRSTIIDGQSCLLTKNAVGIRACFKGEQKRFKKIVETFVA
jgi:hypothetical protein